MIFDKDELKTYKSNLFSYQFICNYIDRICKDMKLSNNVCAFSKTLAEYYVK
jgi:hypothetical protein